MIMTSFISTIAHKIRAGFLGEWMARAWHRFSPSFRVWKKIYGLHVCLDFRDSLIWWATDSRRIEEGEGFDRMLKGVNGNVWDVGCNVGVFSLYAASQGNRVVAFDISPKCIDLLTLGAERNGFNIATVPRAFGVKSFQYTPPADADTRNRPLEISADNIRTSMTFLEAEAAFGRPDFIKLDIEHAEVDFLKSPEFQAWIKSGHIPLLVELHEKHYWDLVWQDVPHIQFSESHIFFNPPSVSW